MSTHLDNAPGPAIDGVNPSRLILLDWALVVALCALGGWLVLGCGGCEAEPGGPVLPIHPVLLQQ